MRKFTSYAILGVIAIIGYLATNPIIRYRGIVDGVLGFSVFYFSFRFYLLTTKLRPDTKDKADEFKFPKSLRDLIYTLVLAVVLALAARQIISMIIWFLSWSMH